MPSTLGIVASGVQGFTPAELSPKLWLDASDSATITSSGGAVSQWNNKGSLGNFTQSTAANQPTTGSATQNGRNVLSFDGGDFLSNATSADWKFMHDGTKYIVAIAAKITSSTGAYLGNSAGEVDVGFYLYKAATGIWHTLRPTGILQNLSTVTAGAGWRVVTVLADPTNGTASLRSSIYANSGSAGRSNTGSNTPSANNPTRIVYVGAVNSSTGSALLMTGEIGEMVVVSGTDATDDNRVKLRDYLNSKWSVY
jgi:hypothetical protein